MFIIVILSVYSVAHSSGCSVGFPVRKPQE